MIICDGSVHPPEDSSHRIRPIAFYLPQFHPIPQNDRWWGKGFTEWTNVTRAKPHFPGHKQPKLPADLGFYDLRLAETRSAQAELATQYGIHGFCYYHYWFGGRRLLERPFNEVHASGEPRLPFCLCWANENWTRAWDGGERDILMEQRYSPEDDRAHIRWLHAAFADPRYIRIDGKPLFLVYRSSRLPDSRRTTEIWREETHHAGIGDLFLCRVESFESESGEPRSLGFDAAVEFQPAWSNLPRHPVLSAALRRLTRHPHLEVYEYAQVVESMLAQSVPCYSRFPCVTPGWDNTPRRGTRGLVIDGSTPGLFKSWLRRCHDRFAVASPDPEVMFINAWNEWAEGTYLEPCRQWGHAYLEAVRSVVCQPQTT